MLIKVFDLNIDIFENTQCFLFFDNQNFIKINTYIN